MIIVSSTEPREFHKLGQLSTLPEKFGCDFLLSLPSLTAGIQRKKFPSDLISSLSDSRISEQIGRMQSLHYKLIILEGRPRYTSDGKLISDSRGRNTLTEKSLNSILLSLQIEHNIPISWSENENSTIEQINNFFAWIQKPNHSSLTSRSGPSNSSSLRSWQRHFLQGFPGIGPGLADSIIEHCGGLPFILTRDLSEIRGISKKKCELINKLMRGICD